VFINGRSKNMLLGPNGQNIYPEEIEDKLNSMTLVVESIVVQRDTKLLALVYPDYDEAKNLNLSTDDIKNIMEQNRNGLNEQLPAYEKIAEIEIREQEFEKTPKRSIKRYLYT
jgi:long-chain acyl-CoA synthetase